MKQLKPSKPEQKAVIRSCLQTVYQAFQFLKICQEILESGVDDTYSKMQIVISLVKSKAAKSKSDGNIDIFLSLYDQLMAKENMVKILKLHGELSATLGAAKIGTSFEIGFYKVLYKAVMCSGLAISQQTQNTISVIR